MRVSDRRPRSARALLCTAAVLASGISPAQTPTAAAPSAKVSLEESGADALRRGDYEAAARSLAAAADAARASGDAPAELRARITLAESQQALGLFAAASATLERALGLALASGDAARIAAVRGALGNSYVAAGDFARAAPQLVEATAQARAAGARALAAALGNNLGNQYALRATRARGAVREQQQALADAAYSEAAADARAAAATQLAARILANQARLALARADRARARSLVLEASAAVASAPVDREAVLTRVHLGRTLVTLIETEPRPSRDELLQAHALLLRALDDATAQADVRGRAWAEGTLGALYAASGRNGEALTLMQRGLDDAQQSGARDAELRFETESARLLQALGREDEALAAYRAAVEDLAEIRPGLELAYGADESFEEGAGRVYRELAALLLARASRAGDPTPDLLEVQRVLESFKAAELRDYFQDDCVDAWRARIATAADASLGAVVVYPILLDDRLELLVTSAAGIRRLAVPIGREALSAEVRSLRELLVKRTTRQYLQPAQHLYDWLVRPYEELLGPPAPSALVFVPDGILRTIPMAALHDGERFLIERTPLAITPGLELTDPQPLQLEGARFLIGGLTEGVQGFAPLPHVREELQSIQKRFGGDVLLDQAFVEPDVAARIAKSPYSVVHLATHGVLGADVSESFLLTHDGRIELQELSRYVAAASGREQPIELISLSACETAVGDERAALGLSGLAVKAGARSALGALWTVNDESASLLMEAFYEQLQQPGTSRAHALQRAQLKLLSDPATRHPAHWAAFLLISNWL